MSTFLGSIASGFIGLGQQALNHFYTEQSVENAAELNYKYGEKAAGNADARTRMLYNDLYSPKAQVQQLTEAGLSPSVFYAGTAGGNVGQAGAQGGGAGAQQGKQYNFDVMQAAAAGANIELMKSEARKNNAEAEVTEETGKEEKQTYIQLMRADTDKAFSQADLNNVIKIGQKLQNDFDEYRNAIKDATWETEIEIIEKKAEEIDKQCRILTEELISAEAKADVDKEMIETRKQIEIQELEQLIAQTLMTDEEAKKYHQEMRYFFFKIRREYEQNKIWQFEANTQRKWVNAQVKQFAEQNRLTRLSIETGAKTSILNSASNMINGMLMFTAIGGKQGGILNPNAKYMPKIGFNVE